MKEFRLLRCDDLLILTIVLVEARKEVIDDLLQLLDLVSVGGVETATEIIDLGFLDELLVEKLLDASVFEVVIIDEKVVALHLFDAGIDADEILVLFFGDSTVPVFVETLGALDGGGVGRTLLVRREEVVLVLIDVLDGAIEEGDFRVLFVDGFLEEFELLLQIVIPRWNDERT